MELSLSVYFFRCFLTVVLWQTTVWRTVYLSESNATTPCNVSSETGTNDNKSSLVSSSSSSSETTAATTSDPNTSSSQTNSSETQEDKVSTGSVTALETTSSASSSQTTAVTVLNTSVQDTSSSQTSSWVTGQSSSISVVTTQTSTNNAGDQAQDPNNEAFPFHVIYIVVGVSGGILVIAIVISDVFFLRNKRRKAKHTSMTEATSETGFHNYEVVDLQGSTSHPGISHSVDSRGTFQEKHAASRIQSLDVKQTTLMENVPYQSNEDELATLPDFMNQSTSIKKKLEDRDDPSDDDGMMMFDNVAYESLASLRLKNTSSSTNRELSSREHKTHPLVPKP